MRAKGLKMRGSGVFCGRLYAGIGHFFCGRIPNASRVAEKSLKPEEVCNKFVDFYVECVIFITYFSDFPKVYYFSIVEFTYTHLEFSETRGSML